MPDLQECVREAHPEVSFAVLAGSSGACPTTRRRPKGRLSDVTSLPATSSLFDPQMEPLRQGRSRVEVDDVLDAVVCLVTAYRISISEAVVLRAVTCLEIQEGSGWRSLLSRLSADIPLLRG